MSAAAVFLYVMIGRGDGYIAVKRTPHPTYASCFAALDRMKIAAPAGAENEVAVVAFCGDRLDERDAQGGWISPK